MEIDRELIFLNKNFEDQDELFNFMADVLLEKGYVTEEYRSKIKERENSFPTGFRLKNVNVAMPHTDPNYTKASKLILLKLEKPVSFKNAEDGSTIDVEIVFGLTFENRDKHIEDLMKLATLLQSDEKLIMIKDSNNEEEINVILDTALK